ncbi:GldG family protein [Candidatus Poribacteria bacterium]
MPKKWMTIIGCAGFGLIILTFGIYAATSVFSWHIKSLLGIGIAGVVVFWILTAMTSRAARYGSNVAVMILLAFCILVLVNFMSSRRSARLDTTEGKQFSLSEQTKKILSELDRDINITAFYSERHYRRRTAQDLLNEYAQQSSRLHLSLVDPNVNPGLAIGYQIKQDGVVIFEAGEKRTDAKSSQNEEQDFTSAILKLLSTEQRKVYFLEGHGERDIDGYDENSLSNLTKLIEADNYLVEKLILGERVPDDCDVLIVAGPEKSLMPQEEEAIARYLDADGKAIIMIDPSPSASMAGLLKRWGVEVHDDIILDPIQQVNGIISVPATIRYDEEHSITIPLMAPGSMRRVMTFFPVARSLAPGESPGKTLEITQLVKTSDGSWGETDTEALLSEQRARPDEGQDLSGPMCVAIAVALKEKPSDVPPPMPGQTPVDAKERRVLVAIGDSDFVADKWLQQGNPDLFMNSLNWLVEEEGLISIRTKDQEQATVRTLSGRQLRFVTYSSIFAIPLILLIVGGVVWWKRR